MAALPEAVPYLIVGAGVHGLSTAWHLALELKASGRGSGRDILVLDKSGPGAGATGIACGCVRNLYMTSALHPIIRHSVDVWMSDPVNLGFQQVGYVSAGEANQQADYEAITASQNAAGYPSDLYVGKEARAFLERLWPDFRTKGIEVVLHEKPSGYAGTRQAVWGLAQKCREQGVAIRSGVEVTGYDLEGARVRRVLTGHGAIAADLVVLGLGAWAPGTGACSACRTGSPSAIRTAPWSRRPTCGPTGACARARSTTSRPTARPRTATRRCCTSSCSRPRSRVRGRRAARGPPLRLLEERC